MYSRGKTLKSALTMLLLQFMLCSVASHVFGDINPRMKLLARRAAHTDALRNLAENIYGLRLDARTTVRDFVVSSDNIRTRLSVVIQGAQETDYIENDDGSAEVTVEITLGAIQNILGRRLQYDSEVIEATGYGVPPGMPQTGSPSAFSGSMVRAVGYGLPPLEQNMSAAESDLLGMRAAKNDALRNLAEQVDRVRINANTLVQDYAVQNDQIRSVIRTVLNNARVVSERKLADGRYEVEVETDIGALNEFIGR
jgi:hypothetical protein